MSGKPQLPKENKSTHKCKCSWLSIFAYFLIVVEMGLGLACTIVGPLVLMDNPRNNIVNKENCYYYEDSSGYWDRYTMRRECSNTNSDAGYSLAMAFTLGGMVIFSSGIIQMITRDKPEYGVLFSIVAMLFVMHNITTIPIAKSDTYYQAQMITLEFLLIPVSGIIYILQKGALKKTNEKAATETVVSSV